MACFSLHAFTTNMVHYSVEHSTDSVLSTMNLKVELGENYQPFAEKSSHDIQDRSLTDMIPNNSVSTFKLKNSIPKRIRSFDLKPAFPGPMGKQLESESKNAVTTNPLARHVHNVTQEIIKNNKFVDNLTPEEVVDLPVGVRKCIMGMDYILAVESIIITPTHAYLVAFMSIDIPQAGKLAFAGSEIMFTQSGGFSGDVILQLIEAPTIPFGKEISLNLNTEQTFAVFDCQGFKHLSIGGDFIFSRKLLIPDTDSLDNVKASFSAPELSHWNDLIVNVNIDPFQVNGLTDFSFFIDEAVLDFSDLKNPSGINLPEKIDASYNGESNLWRGFSLKKMTVKLPSQFNETGNNQRTEINVHDFIIDETGFTGWIESTRLLSIDNGRMGNWAFSVDSLYVSIESNQFVKAGINGNVLIPIFKNEPNDVEINDSSLTKYSAVICPGGEYIFSLSLQNAKPIPLWNAEAVIYNSSTVNVEVMDGKFIPEAILNGKLTIVTKNACIPDIEFEQLKITTEQPYVQLGYIGLGTNEKSNLVSGFPVQLRNITSKSSEGKIRLDFELILNLVKESDGAFGAEGGFSIIGEAIENAGLLSFSYNRTVVKRLNLDIDGGGFTLNGFVEHYNEDPTYGKGYHGKIRASFKPGLELSAYALFGKHHGFRYWFADAMLNVGTCIPVFPGLNIYGFGGGAYYHMTQTAGQVDSGSSTIGQALSGIRYIPNEKIRLGIKASVNLGSPSKEAFNADATFDIVFNNHGGVNRITFNGTAAFMTPPESLSDNKIKDRFTRVVDNKLDTKEELKELTHKGSLSAIVFLDFDFENDCMHGDFKVYANIADGLIKGIGSNYLAGHAVIHFSNDEWYLHIGHPDRDKRVGLDFIGIARFDSYFMVGTNIPGSPSPPAKVKDLLGNVDLDYMSEINKLEEGSGIAFGAGVELNTGERTFLIFYGSFEAGLGFDVMLKNYGNDIACSGREGVIGINGWYANGQAYAYFDGEIGVKVDLPFKSGKFKILSIGAAAVLQAKLPNPVWMKGVVGGNYNILGGLIKGECVFEVVIGEECELVHTGSAVASLDIIADITPKDNEEDVDVFAAPQVVFNMPVDKEFEIAEIDGSIKKYRIKLEKFSLYEKNTEIYGDLEWNNENDVVALNSFEVLPPNTYLNFFVMVSFEVFKSGQWTKVFYDNKKVTEQKEITFKTGSAPDYIPEHNILYSYPLDAQFNMYPQESQNGFIQLIKGQGYLFSDPKWDNKVRYSGKKASESSLHYDYQNMRLDFKIPNELDNNNIYTLNVLSIPKNQNYVIDNNIQSKSSSVKFESNSVNSMEIKTKYAEDNLEILQEKQLFSLRFRTSKYSTFNEKMEQLQKQAEWIYPLYPGVHELGYTVLCSEGFDEFEIHGNDNVLPLINIKAILSTNSFYKEHIYPLEYIDYPLENKYFIKHRDTRVLGIPPIFANYILQDNSRIRLLPDQRLFEIDNSTTKISFVYNLMHHYSEDFNDLQIQIANDLLTGGEMTTRKLQIVNSLLPVIRKGSYKIEFNYTLPNGKSTSNYPLTIYNPVNFTDI